MKVLLTGATGLVGSHVLDALRARGVPVAVLLRPRSNPRFIAAHLPHVELHAGAIDEPASLDAAVRAATHVIHCAGATKALRTEGFFAANQAGTRHLVDAINRRRDAIARLVHVSSLAAAGPALTAREDDPPHPVSEYGRSKLAGEREVTERCQADFVVLRPPGVYGPRDTEFLRLFEAAQSHLRPLFGGGRQQLSLVYVRDLAEAIVTALTHPRASRRTYYVASPEVLTARQLAEEVAAQLKTWTVPLPLPTAILWPVCAAQEIASRLSGKPSVLSRQKYAELRAPAWVCDPSRLRRELDFECRTGLREGIALTLEWYRREGWL